MSYSYFVFRPRGLPIEPSRISEEFLLPLGPAEAIHDALASVIPDAKWARHDRGSATVEGKWMEFYLRPSDGDPSQFTLSIRCSLRADYRPHVQELVDRLGWIALDEGSMLYQPNRTPVRV